MQLHSSRTSSLHRSSGRLLLLALLAIAIAAAVMLLARSRAEEPLSADSEEAGGETRRRPSTYRNRAILRSPAPSGPREPEGLRIVGDVYDTDGNTLAGATVIATTFEVAGNIPSTARSVKSDQRGRFELSLPDGTYQLKAELAGYGPTNAVAHSGDTVSLALSRSGVITGRVLDERKEPVRRFTIDVLSAVPDDVPAPPPMYSQTFESPDGTFRIDQIPPWDVILKATAEQLAPGFSDMLSVERGDTATVELALSRGCVLSGRVEDAQGTPLPGVFVDAESRLGAGYLSEQAVKSSADVQQTQTEDDGTFRLEHVPTGEVHVRAYDGSHAVTTLASNISDCGKVDPVKVVMSPGGSIRGVARREDGSPIPHAKITLLARSVGFVNVAADEEGRYRIDDLPAGRVRVELRDGSRATMVSVDVKEGMAVNRDISLFPEGTGELRGRVTAGDKPLAGIRLLVTANRGRKPGFERHTPVTDEDGNFRVPSLVAGNYLITVMTTSVGQGVQVDDGGVTTVNLDVTPRPVAEDTN
ncbi:carboxypeptidase regulatory-like domain-containing protein [Sorangium sp. So ce1151]|uniref:carboxypeptidase regulatory-like domain-containing protein n=1 Tax=Sorangium sp. So ce1151 TaxID=3133332 RepID=UPI003F606667